MRTIPLSETTSFIVDNRGKTAPTTEVGIPLIATNCINNRDLYPIYENIRYVSNDTYDSWFRSHPEPGDIILTLKGSQNGAVCLVPDPVGFVIAQDMVALRVNHDVIEPSFLLAALRSPFVQEQIKNLDVSGVIPHLKKSDFDKLEIPYPSMIEQCHIGKNYLDSSLKIDLLRRQNKTIESIIETLFRHWFIDGSPDDWEKKPLDKIAHYLNGIACQKYPAKNSIDRLPVLKIRELRSGFSSDCDWVTSDIDPKFLVGAGDIIFSWSASLMIKVWDGEIAALNQHLFKVTSDEYPDWFIYLWTKHHMAQFIAIAETKATTMGHIKRSDLSNSETIVPDAKSMEKINAQIEPLFSRLKCNNSSIRSLENMRDTLLPKLMNGDIRVSYETTA